MLKAIILAGAAMMATPALAQDTTTLPQTGAAPGSTQVTPAPKDGQLTPAPQPDGTTTLPTPAPQDGATTTPDSATAQPDMATTTGDQAKPAADDQSAKVAAIVTTEFPNYDADKSGDLSATEFASWMDALKKASDPSFDGSKPESKAWVDQAFAAADADKSKAVSKDELTQFLTKGAA